MKPRFQAPRGTRDILPGEMPAWRLLERTARSVFERYGFREIRTPILESTELFRRSVGASTDIVRKEMYTIGSGGDSVSLRPESTAPVVRAFVEHALHRTIAAGFPERLYYIGPMFRHERPQKGRQRQFHQIGVEVLGAEEPLADAETLEMLWSFLGSLGIEGRELRVGSVGDARCRPAFRDALRSWLETHLDRLCSDCQRRYQDNPLRVFDCKVEADRRLLRNAPTMPDHLCEPCRDHFAEVRRWLDAYRIPYRVDPGMVRGLDYYQRTVFEVVCGGLGAQDALLGGGRYDGLVESLGGPAIPGFGFAIGMERLLLVLPDERADVERLDLAVVALGEEGFRAGVELVKRLRAKGIRVTSPLAVRPMGAQLRRAERSGARFALFVGKDELASGRYGFKDLASGEQTEIDEGGLVKRLGGRHGG